MDTFNGPNAPNAFGTPLRVITVKPTKRVDFNMTYRFNENFTVTFDITNLFDSKFQDYFGPDPSLYPRDTRLYDRTFEVGMRYHY
ncbi:TonB dependent receptor [compost metagenome]